MMREAGKPRRVRMPALSSSQLNPLIEAKQPMIYRGGYDGDAVSFCATVSNQEAIACNCSIGHQKGFIYLIVPQFRIYSASG